MPRLLDCSESQWRLAVAVADRSSHSVTSYRSLLFGFNFRNENSVRIPRLRSDIPLFYRRDTDASASYRKSRCALTGPRASASHLSPFGCRLLWDTYCQLIVASFVFGSHYVMRYALVLLLLIDGDFEVISCLRIKSVIS